MLAQIQVIDGQLSHAIEAYNLANLKLEAINPGLKENARHLDVAKSSLRSAQTHLSERLVSLYVNGSGGNALEVVLGAESLDDLLNRLDAVERVSNQDARVLGEVEHFAPRSSSGSSVSTAPVPLRPSSSPRRRTSAGRSKGSSPNAQRLLSSIKSEIASLEAAERLRQQRLEAQARARLAAASVQRQGGVEYQQASLFDSLALDASSRLLRTPATAASSGSRCSSSVCPTCGAARARRASTAPV